MKYVLVLVGFIPQKGNTDSYCIPLFGTILSRQVLNITPRVISITHLLLPFSNCHRHGHKASTFIWSCGFGIKAKPSLLFTFFGSFLVFTKLWEIYLDLLAVSCPWFTVSCHLVTLAVWYSPQGDYQVCFLTESLCLIKKSSRLNKVTERAESSCSAEVVWGSVTRQIAHSHLSHRPIKYIDSGSFNYPNGK